jgi:hypothetical protein
MRAIAAHARQLAAAEFSFQASVELREALDVVVAEVEAFKERRESEDV